MLANQYVSKLQALRYAMNVYTEDLVELLKHTQIDAYGEMQTDSPELLHDCQLSHDRFVDMMNEFQEYRSSLHGTFEPEPEL